MSHIPQLVIVDVDYTLLRTRTFNNVLTIVLAQLIPGSTPEQLHDELTIFTGPSGGYDIEQHLYSKGLDYATLQERIRHSLESYDLMYDDAVETLDTWLGRTDLKIWLLTKGEPSTQNLKIELIIRELQRRLGRDIAPLDHTVIQVDKDDYLREMKLTSASIVDDNPHQLGRLQPGPRLAVYQLYRPDDEHHFGPSDQAGVHIISALTDLL